jgi:hypothetical protein
MNSQRTDGGLGKNTQERIFPGLEDSSKYSDDRIASIKLSLGTLASCVATNLGGRCLEHLNEDHAFFFAHPKKTDVFVIGCKYHVEPAATIAGAFAITIRYALNLLNKEESHRTYIKREEEKKRVAEQQEIETKRSELRERVALGIAILEDKNLDMVRQEEIHAWMASHPNQVSTFKIEIEKNWAQKAKASLPSPARANAPINKSGAASDNDHRTVSTAEPLRNRMNIPQTAVSQPSASN